MIINTFEVGDRIRFKTKDELITQYGFGRDRPLDEIDIPFFFNQAMSIFCGHFGVIENVDYQGDNLQKIKIHFVVEELNRLSPQWSFGNDMCVPVNNLIKESYKAFFLPDFFQKNTLEEVL